MPDAVVTPIVPDPALAAVAPAPATPVSGEVKPPAEVAPAVAAKADDYELEAIADGVLDAESVKGVSTLAKELGLSKEAAGKMLAAQDDQLRAFQDGQITAYQARQAEWAEASAADPEIGGALTAATDKNIASAMKRFDKEGTFAAELEAVGFGNHPVIRRLLSRIGATMSEDGTAQGSPAQNTSPRSRADRMYGQK